jgi:hypothetical protein
MTSELELGGREAGTVATAQAELAKKIYDLQEVFCIGLIDFFSFFLFSSYSVFFFSLFVVVDYAVLLCLSIDQRSLSHLSLASSSRNLRPL